MKLGIDFGTTNTVISYLENNFPVIMRFNYAGLTKDVFPSVSFYASGMDKGVHGSQALEYAFSSLNGTLVRSLKRSLKNYFDGQLFSSGDFQAEEKKLLINFLKSLKEQINQSLYLSPDEEIEALLTVPANSNGAQRAITRECFQAAGFSVFPTILEEPTASAIEFSFSTVSERLRAQKNPLYVLVYDLGGGTFDVSLIRIEQNNYSVVATSGIEQLGGDDFDHLLFQMILEQKELSGLTPLQEKLLLHRCCEAKQTLANTIDPKYLKIDLEEAHICNDAVKLKVEEYYERILPLVNQTLYKIEEVLQSEAVKATGIQGIEQIEKIYLVGGSSQLPLVLRRVQEKYGRDKVYLSSLPFGSIALGACRMVQQDLQIEPILSRTFGVMRVVEGGEYFDPIFEKGTKIPTAKRFEIYPQHNIGHYRYLECSDYQQGQLISPRLWSEIFFPYDPEWDLSSIPSKEHIQSKRYAYNPVIEEFACDENGIISVRLHRQIDSLSVRHEIWK